jgi:Arc/MetJ-type ribon-helix-helix transcriptional regulator
MAKTTIPDWRILWNFINGQIATGKYSSVSEVVRTALRHFEEEENQKKSLMWMKKSRKIKIWITKLSDAE